jgi:hypothetical protein
MKEQKRYKQLNVEPKNERYKQLNVEPKTNGINNLMFFTIEKNGINN